MFSVILISILEPGEQEVYMIFKVFGVCMHRQKDNNNQTVNTGRKRTLDFLMFLMVLR